MSHENIRPDPDSPAGPESSNGPTDLDEEAARLRKKLESASLDLNIERVEERISPRETNVFDK